MALSIGDMFLYAAIAAVALFAVVLGYVSIEESARKQGRPND